MGVRIQELPETTGIKKEDVLIVEDGQGTKKGTVQQLDEALGVSQLKEDLSNLETDLTSGLSELEDTDKFVNLFDYRTVTANMFIDKNSETSINGYYCSDYIEVKPLTWYCIPFTSTGLCSLYNDSKEYIGKCKKSDYTQPSTQYSIFKTNATTKYVRVNGYNGGSTPSVNVSPTKYMIVEGQTYPSRYHKFGENTISDSYKISNYLYGKTLLTYGDSITEGVNASTDAETGYKNTYAGLVAKRNGMNFVNLGWTGSTMADDDQKPFIHNGQIYSHFDNKLVTPDYITVWFGWNDYAHAQNGTGITLGTITSEEESTYYGAYIKACKLLIQKFPKARIGLVVPYGMDAEWRNAVRTVAKKFGLPYLDLYNNCPCIFNNEDGVNTDIANLRQSTFLADGTHPNDDGYEWLSTAYEDFLRRI